MRRLVRLTVCQKLVWVAGSPQTAHIVLGNLMITDAVNRYFEVANLKFLESQELFDFFIRGGEVNDTVAFIADCMVMWVRLVLIESLGPQDNFFDVTVCSELIEIAIDGRQIDVGESCMDSRC